MILLFFPWFCPGIVHEIPWKPRVGSWGMITTADHGPCVSGAHNTIVAARAGKDRSDRSAAVVEHQVVGYSPSYTSYNWWFLCLAMDNNYYGWIWIWIWMWIFYKLGLCVFFQKITHWLLEFNGSELEDMATQVQKSFFGFSSHQPAVLGVPPWLWKPSYCGWLRYPAPHSIFQSLYE